ncbi:MAG: NAD(P)H-quinone oxidoreductase, partial [Angustibacter sp.]
SPAAGEALVAVSAFGINRADLLQRAGHYPPPAGASSILGLECSGVIRELPPEYRGPLALGQQVCALLSGGGYAQLVGVPTGQLLPLPAGYCLDQAAALPEGLCTAWLNLVQLGGLRRGHSVLIHGGAGGVGTFAVQLATALGARVAVTAGSAAKLAHCRQLGANICINYHDSNFDAEVRGHIPAGVDIILDIIGAKYLQQNLSALAPGGRLITIGLQGGRHASVDLAVILQNGLQLTGSALRQLPDLAKAELLTQIHRNVWPLLESGAIVPSLHRVDGWAEARQAHDDLSAGRVLGKLVLRPN